MCAMVVEITFRCPNGCSMYPLSPLNEEGGNMLSTTEPRPRGKSTSGSSLIIVFFFECLKKGDDIVDELVETCEKELFPFDVKDFSNELETMIRHSPRVCALVVGFPRTNDPLVIFRFE